jgi:hypothetical protein
MLSKGPIPRFVHGIIEYVAGVVLIVAPFVLDYDKSGAKATSIVAGLLIILLAACTEGISGIVDQLGIQAHAVLDVVFAALLVASPFLFGFSNDGEPTALMIVLGVGYLLLFVSTRYVHRR